VAVRRGWRAHQFLEAMIFWRPGNLYLARRRDSAAWRRAERASGGGVLVNPKLLRAFTAFTSLQRIDMRIWPMLTRAQVPRGLPKAPRMPCCSRSAPAQESILLMRSTWYGCTRMRRWKVSLPAFFTMYLLAAMRAASSASEPTFSFSKLHARV